MTCAYFCGDDNPELEEPPARSAETILETL